MALIPITKVFPCSLPWRVCFYSWVEEQLLPERQAQSSCPFSWSPGTELLSLLLVARRRSFPFSWLPQVWILSLLLVPRERKLQIISFLCFWFYRDLFLNYQERYKNLLSWLMVFSGSHSLLVSRAISGLRTSHIMHTDDCRITVSRSCSLNISSYLGLRVYLKIHTHTHNWSCHSLCLSHLLWQQPLSVPAPWLLSCKAHLNIF